MKFLDLHTHTSASDGILKPAELIDYAITKGISVMAITDHDTVGGIGEALDYAEKLDFNLIPGIEFSVDYPEGSFHLVGLYVDHLNNRLSEILLDLKTYRDGRVYHMIDDLRDNGVNITVEEVQKEADGGSIGRPHVARVLVNHGYGANIKDIFQNYLIEGKPGYIKKKKITVDDAISVINDAGGIPILAHPISLESKLDKPFESILVDLIKRGVMGIEAYASMHTEEKVGEYLGLADKYNLLVTGGSDFHGDKDERIGYYLEDRAIPFSIYQDLATIKKNIY